MAEPTKNQKVQIPQEYANTNSSINLQNVTTETSRVNPSCSSRGCKNRILCSIILENINQNSKTRSEAAVNISDMSSNNPTDNNTCLSNILKWRSGGNNVAYTQREYHVQDTRYVYDRVYYKRFNNNGIESPLCEEEPSHQENVMFNIPESEQHNISRNNNMGLRNQESLQRSKLCNCRYCRRTENIEEMSKVSRRYWAISKNNNMMINLINNRYYNRQNGNNILQNTSSINTANNASGISSSWAAYWSRRQSALNILGDVPLTGTANCNMQSMSQHIQSISNIPRNTSLGRTNCGFMINREIPTASDSFGNEFLTGTVQNMPYYKQSRPISTRTDRFFMPYTSRISGSGSFSTVSLGTYNNSVNNRNNVQNNVSQIITPIIPATSSTVSELKKKDETSKNSSSDATEIQPTLKKVSENKGECPICLENLSSKSIASTLCGHIFCMQCIQAVAKSKRNRCPTCRSTLKGYHELFL